jgi:hypothetical protein
VKDEPASLRASVVLRNPDWRKEKPPCPRKKSGEGVRKEARMAGAGEVMQPDPGQGIPVVLPAGVWRSLVEFIEAAMAKGMSPPLGVTDMFAEVEQALLEATGTEAQD